MKSTEQLQAEIEQLRNENELCKRALLAMQEMTTEAVERAKREAYVKAFTLQHAFVEYYRGETLKGRGQ